MVEAQTQEDFTTYEDYFAFDFNLNAGSPIMEGFTDLRGNTFYDGNAYGWNSSVGWADQRDRGAPNNLTRDFNWFYWGYDRQLLFDVEDGVNDMYRLNFTCGDQSSSWWGMDVYAEGNLILEGLQASATVFIEEVVEVECSDDLLDIYIRSNQSGATWRINGLEIHRAVLDNEAWMQQQIYNNIGLIVVFFVIGLACAVAFAVALQK